MPAPFLALITPLTGGAPDQGLPGGGGSGNYPDQGLPGGQPGVWPRPPSGNRPDNSLPGGGGHPDQGLPGGGYPGNRPPWAPGHPDQGLPGSPPGFWGGSAPPLPDQGLPQGGETIPPEQLPIPEPPPEHADDLVVAIHKPGATSWEVSAYDVQPDQGQPTPTPHKGKRK